MDSQRCRTCLARNHEMRDINAVVSITGENICLSDILEKFYNYKVAPDDQLSHRLCINCVKHLTMTYSFKVLIDHSARKLSDEVNLVITDPKSENANDYLFDPADDEKLSLLNKIKPKKHLKRKYFQRSSLEGSCLKTDTSKINTVLYCVICKAKFQSRDSLYNHCINNHPNERTIGRDCELCNEKFNDFKPLIIHRKKHMLPYLCEKCWEGFFNPYDLEHHFCKSSQVERQQEQGKVLKQCDQCGKSYPPSYIKMHVLIHGEQRPYSCKYCPKTFKVPCALNSHVLWNHKRTRNHKCDVCNASFISASAKSVHIRKLHLKEKKHCCESCGKSFFSKSELQRHNLTHTGAKNFHCHFCEKSYQTRYGLNTHLKSHMQQMCN